MIVHKVYHYKYKLKLKHIKLMQFFLYLRLSFNYKILKKDWIFLWFFRTIEFNINSCFIFMLYIECDLSSILK